MRPVVPADPRGPVVAAMQTATPSRAILTHHDARAAKINEGRAAAIGVPTISATAVASIPTAVIPTEVAALLDTPSVGSLHVGARGAIIALDFVTRCAVHPRVAGARLAAAHFAAAASATLGATHFAAAGLATAASATLSATRLSAATTTLPTPGFATSTTATLGARIVALHLGELERLGR